MDGRRKNNVALHNLTMRESDVVSLVEFHPVVKEEIAWQTDEWTKDTQTDGRMEK